MSSRLSANHLLLSALAKRKASKNPLQAGFTLVELLIVVIIIGILAAVAVPAFLNQQGRARISASQSASISAARGCAAAQVTGDEGTYVNPANITGTCAAAGTESTFASKDFTAGGTESIATVTALGGVALTTCAATAGWKVGTAPACTPTRS